MYAENSLPRLIICGAPGDGKSALLAHLLDEVEGDQLWRRAVLAHRPRALCVADIPAGERDWRSFVAAASIADAALIVVDACRESHSQAKEYLYLARLFKIRTILLAVNKMDLGAYDQTLFELVCDELGSAADGFAAVPVSAISGENVGRPSPALAWYYGPSLIEHIETVTPRSQAVEEAPFRLPVRSAACDADGHRQISGVVASGSVDCGGLLKIMPAGVEAKIDRILVAGLEVDQAAAGQAAVLSLDRPVDCSPGDVLCKATDLLEVSDQFEATIIWLAQDDLLPGRQYWLDLAGQRALATLQPPKHQVDLSSGELVPARTLGAKTVGILDLWTDSPLVFTPFSECRDLGSFSLVDRVSEEIVSAGLIHFALRRSHNIQAQLLDITPQARAAIKGQAPRLLWFTGLSGAGKSTIANLVEKKLHLMGRHTFLLDGDNVRLGLNRDLGFSDADRAENVRRVGETARLMLDAGLIVLAAFISPFRAERRMVREMLPEGRFVEIHIDVPLAEAERRDPKGLYRKARGGGIPNFTGIGSPYEPPEQAEISIDTVSCGAEEAADQIVRYLLRDQT